MVVSFQVGFIMNYVVRPEKSSLTEGHDFKET